MLYGIQTLLLIHVYSALDDPYLLFSHDVVQFCNDYDDKSDPVRRVFIIV